MNEEFFIAELMRIMLETGLVSEMALMITVIAVSLLAKEFLQSFVEGVSFCLKRSFRQGDSVYIDGDKAVIIKIGLLQTILQIRDERGVIWRYVPNNRVKYLKLEKVVDKNGTGAKASVKTGNGSEVPISKEKGDSDDGLLDHHND